MRTCYCATSDRELGTRLPLNCSDAISASRGGPGCQRPRSISPASGKFGRRRGCSSHPFRVTDRGDAAAKANNRKSLVSRNSLVVVGHQYIGVGWLFVPEISPELSYSAHPCHSQTALPMIHSLSSAVN